MRPCGPAITSSDWVAASRKVATSAAVSRRLLPALAGSA